MKKARLIITLAAVICVLYAFRSSLPKEQSAKIAEVFNRSLASTSDEPVIIKFQPEQQKQISAPVISQAQTEIESELREKLIQTNDPEIIMTTVKQYAASARERSVPLLEWVLNKNRVRDDGYESMITRHVIQELAKIETPEAVKILAKELDDAPKYKWNFEYGSDIVAGLKTSTQPEALPALKSYAEYIRTRKAKDPMIKTYLAEKYEEATDLPR